jgi:hypothetical protein
LLIFVWLSWSPHKRRLPEEEAEAFLPPPALPLKSQLKTLATASKKPTAVSERNEKKITGPFLEVTKYKREKF